MNTDKGFLAINSKTITKPVPQANKNIKDKGAVNVRKFCRLVERNMNNYHNLNLDNSSDANRNCKGFFLKIDSANGMKKIFPNNKVPAEKNFYLRFFLTFFNNKTSQFFGNTYKSPLLHIKFSPNGQIEIVDEAVYVYFLTNSVTSDQKIIIECVLVETNKSNYILSQTCEGWGTIDILEDSSLESRSNTTSVNLGTSRSLLNKSANLKNIFPISGASIVYTCSTYRELEKIKFLLPNYVILGSKDQLPGLLFNFLPLKPVLNEPIKLFDFSDIYLKNIEIEISPNLEARLIYFATMYRKQKYEISDDVQLNPVTVKERKLKCGIHNTWTFINSNGLENFVSLNKKENFLFYKGVHHIDFYFNSEFSALALELTYTLSFPTPNNQREEILQTIIGYSLIIPGLIDQENNFRVANLITGPGVTLYGEHLYDPLDSDDKVIKVNYIVSKNKDSYDKTFKEREIEEIRNQMDTLKKNMNEEYNKMVNNKDMEKEKLLRKKEYELEEMESKLRETQRGLKTIYGKEDAMSNYNRNVTENEKTHTRQSSKNMINANNFNNQNNLFNTKDQFSPDERLAPNDINESIEEISHQNYNRNLFEEKNISIIEESNQFTNQMENEHFKMKESISKKPTTKNLPQISEKREEHSPIYSERQYYESIITKNNFNDEKVKFETKKSLMNLDKNTRYEPKYEPQSNERDEFIFYKMFYQKHKNEFGNYSSNIEKNTPKIIYDQSSKDISRRDKADLIAKGLISLENEKNDSLLNYAFERELKDDKKANSFTLQFLAFKPNNDIKDYNQIPDRIFFKFNFWDYEFFSTNVAIVSKPNTQVIPSSTPLILQRENSVLNAKSDEKDMKVQIDFDPSVDPYMDFKDFVDYLLNKQLFIEIYEAEKLFMVGFIKVPLKDLLRQGKPSIYQTKEYTIYDDKFNSKGQLQILLKSSGSNTHKTFQYDSKCLKITNTKDREVANKKKKVMSKPLDVNKLIMQEKEILAKTLSENVEKKNGVDLSSYNSDSNNKTLHLNVDSEMQKRLRAMKYVNNTTNNTNMMFPENKLEELKLKQDKDNQFFKTLNYANRLKEVKKKEILSKTIQDNNKNNLAVSLVLGQPFYNNFIIHNNSSSDELYHLIVTKTKDPKEEENLRKAENDERTNIIHDTVNIVNSPEEWKYLTENNGLIRPNDYQSISPQNYVVVKPNESIPVLIKLLSYDTNVANSNYTVWVYKKSGEPAYFLSITIVKVFPIIDHIFTNYLPESRYGTIKIPNPFKYEKAKAAKILDNYICSDAMINLQQDPSSNDFYFKCKMQNEGHKNQFFIFLYMDSFKSNLYATWKFDLYSMSCIDIHAQIGTKIIQKILLDPERIPRTVHFYSSNSDILFFPEKFNSPLILVPNIPNEIKYVIYPKKEDSHEIIINCVDLGNRELVKGWLVRILPEKPEINHIHNIDCRVGSVTNIKYEFSNCLNSWVIFNFESNNTEILSVVDSRLPFNANEKKFINISIPPQNQMGRAEVVVFVSDTEELYSEVILFQLNYK